MASENPSQQMPNPALQHPMPDQAQPMLNPQMVPNPAQIAVNPVNVGVGVPFQSASLYVGDLHPDVTDALLYDIFNAVGPVASIRVCRDAVTRRSLGYAYVNFHNPNDAERALDTMNYTMIKDRPCRIMWSQRDPSLRKTGAGNVFVKHLDLSIDNKALFDTFSLFGNILSCKVVTDSTGKSRGYGFVHFETTEAADEAIKKINGMEIAGKEVFVGKFLKKSDRPSAKDWTNVYVKNIPKSWGKDQLEDFFADCGAISSSVVMTDSDGVSKGFGFVDFVEHEGAEKACEDFNDFELEVDRKEVVDTDSYNYEEDYQNEHDEYVPKPKADEPEINKESTEDPDSADKENAHSENENDIGKEKDVRDGKKGESQTVKLKLMVCRAQRREERERELSRKFEAIKMEKQNKYVGVNLFIKNLDDRVDDEILRKEFEPYGGITSARVMREKLNSKEGNKLGPSKGFGFVCFSAPEEAVKAVTEMNGKLVFGKPIYVALAQRKEERRAQLEAQHRQHQRIMSVPPQMFFNQMNPNMNVPNINGMNNMNVSVPNMNMNMQNMPNFPRMNNFNMPPMMQQVPQQQGQAQAGQGQPRANAKTFLQPTQNPRGPVPQMRSMNPNMMMMPQQNQARAPNQNMNVQFNQNARNTGMGGMPPRQFQTGMRMPNQGPMQMGNRQDQPLTSTVLANASPEERKAMIGEKLYPMVQRLSNRDVAAKITGMLLEMENAELLHLLESPDSLISKVNEALEVLQSAAQSHPQK